jgi:hypothetical protein
MDSLEIQRTDLNLLLDSYKNNVELSTLMLEQLRNIGNSQEKFLEDQKIILEKNKEVLACLLKISDKLGLCSEELKNANSKLIESEKVFATYKEEEKSMFQKISSKINLVYVGMGTLIVSLLGIIYLLIEKLHMIEDIYRILVKGS